MEFLFDLLSLAGLLLLRLARQLFFHQHLFLHSVVFALLPPPHLFVVYSLTWSKSVTLS